MNRSDRSLKGLGALILLLAALYLPTVFHGFHFDDFHMVQNNQLIKRWGSWVETLTTPSITSVPVAQGMYRPVLMASFALNYSTGGLNPAGYHVVNVWLHLLTTCFVAALALRLWPGVSPGWVLLSASLWAVHPLHTQAVAYVSSRSCGLAALWMVLSLWLYVAAGDRGRSPRETVPRYAGSLVAYALALGSKEIAVTLPGLLLLAQWRLKQLSDSRFQSSISRWIPFLLLTGAYLVWRKILFGAVGVVYPVRPEGLNFQMQLEGILAYLRLWFFPAHQSIVHSQPDGVGAGPGVAFGLLAAGALTAWRLRGKVPGLTFALGWAGATFLPIAFASSLNLVVAEHHAYLPSIGFALGLPPLLQALARISRPPSAVPIVGLAVVGMLGVVTVWRNRVWADDLTLWADAARKVPESSRVHNNLGLEYEARGQLEEAFSCYGDAIRCARDPFGESTARNNLGALYLKTGQSEEALAQLRWCLKLKPTGTGELYNNLGLALSDSGLPREAQEAYLRALDEDPGYIPAVLNLGVLLFKQGQREQAGSLFERAVRLDPDHPLAHLALGKFYVSEGDWGKATEAFRRLVELSPRSPEGYLFLAVTALRVDPSQRRKTQGYLAEAIRLGWEPDPQLLERITSDAGS